MNPTKKQLHALLHDLLPADVAPIGPTRTEVLTLLHRERARRRQWRGLVCLVMVTALGLWLLPTRRPAASNPIKIADVGPAPIVLEHVNDEQLLALLRNTPAALMEGPNGERTLLVVCQ